MKKVLIVDDVPGNRELIREALTSPEYLFSEAENASQALQIMRNQAADIVITDVCMPGISGVDLLNELHSEYPETIVILVTSFGTVESAVEAMKAGARDYITRPIGLHQLRLIVQCALEHLDLRTEVRILRDALDEQCGFKNMLGHSHALLQMLDQAARVAPTNSTVLIQGETGTGKELLARAIHAGSSRSAKPFITVNSGAIPRDLLESELFGHVKGSFTSAASLGSASMRERSMASHSVRCSTAPFEGNSGCRSTSAPTTIHSTGSVSGKPIYGYWS